MKTFKLICATLLLALSLSLPVLADTNPGDSHGPGCPEPADPGATTENSGVINTVQDISDSTGLTLADVFWALASIV